MKRLKCSHSPQSLLLAAACVLSWRGHEAREAVKALRLVLEKERRNKAARRMQMW
jgi:hypothetical protein